jgi:hypothetical protein
VASNSPQSPKYWDYGQKPLCPAIYKIFKKEKIMCEIGLKTWAILLAYDHLNFR